MTAPRREPNYNAIIERSSAVVENMVFAMLTHAKKPKSWWDNAFDWATYVLDIYIDAQGSLTSSILHLLKLTLKRNRT